MMRLLRRGWRRLLGTLASRRAEQDLADELNGHVELLAEANMRRGMTRAEAYRQARLKFGNVEVLKEQYRDQRGLPVIETTRQDLRYAWRLMRRNPGFATVAILSLAIGIGANTAIFSLVNAVILRPLPYPDPDQLFAVREVRRENDVSVFPVNPVHARAWGAQCPSIAQVALLRGSRAQVAIGADPALLVGARVTHDFFALLGITPILGRTFREDEEEDGRDRVVIVTEGLWRTRFNSDPSVLGKTVLVDGVDHEIVGVLREPVWRSFTGGMQSTPSNGRYELFRPLVVPANERNRMMGNYNYAALIRLKPGVSAETAIAEMNVVQARFPGMTGDGGGLEATLIPLHRLLTGGTIGLWMLAAAVGAVLLIVCVNLANLLLSRVAARSRESAVRSAIGASRPRLFMQALTESALLSMIGGAGGVLVAGAIIQVLVGAGSVELPRLHEVRVDTSVLMFALLATIVTVTVFGVMPAWRLASQLPGDALRAGGRAITEGRQGLRLRETLIGAQVGMSTALLILAGLLTVSLNRLLAVDKGFDVEHVLTVDIDTAGPQYADAETMSRFLDRIAARFSAIPGVDAAGFTTQLPLEGNTWNDAIYRDAASERHRVDNRYASPGFFRAMGIAVLHGRAFGEEDRARGVAVLSQKAAELIWPGDPNPVGREFIGEDDKPKLLVGIVSDVRATLQDTSPPHAYYPYWQRPPGDVAMVIRSDSSPDELARPIREAIHGEDPTLPVAPILAAQVLVDGSVSQRRFQSMLIVAFAASALLVASIGIYGVVAYAVTRRRNELGIRLALGASRIGLIAMIIRQGMAPVVGGIAVGVVMGLLAGQLIRGLLFGVQSTDLATVASVALLLFVVGFAACLIPARRAVGAPTLAALRLD
jgi:predicted permease